MDHGEVRTSLLDVLPRLADPATSTRRTAAARARLADHPATAELLDAGVRVLLEELGATATDGAGVPTRFFDLLSASRVCAAATAVGPLRVTPAHLRDRWARQSDFVEDLFAVVLWRQHWQELFASHHRTLPVPRTPDDLAAVATAVAEADLVTWARPVAYRLEVLASALAPARPALRAMRLTGYGRVEAGWARAILVLHDAVGMRVREGADVLDVARGVIALLEGASLRLLAVGEGPAARAEAVRLVSVGVQALWRSAFEADPAAPRDSRRWLDRFPWPEPDRGDVADVMTRLTDPVAGTRRTAVARRRLAHDAVTGQLLEGGTRVLAQDLGVTRPGDPQAPGAAPGKPAVPSRFFDVLSAARVVATAPTATLGQLRDRWASQEHYLDDLLAYATWRMEPTVDRGLLQRLGTTDVVGAVRASVRSRLMTVTDPGVRLRLLLTTLRGARPGIGARLEELYRAEDRAMASVLDRLRVSEGGDALPLRPGVGEEELARAEVALGEGLVLRALATGDTGIDDDGAGSLLLRASSAVFRGSLDHP